MKEPNPNATIQIDALDIGDVPDEVNLDDVSLTDSRRGRPTPPPLPIEARASLPPTGSAAPPQHPQTVAPPAKRPSWVFYSVILLAVVGLGVAGGAVLLRTLAPKAAAKTSPAATAVSASASSTPGVITIPTVEFGNE